MGVQMQVVMGLGLGTGLHAFLVSGHAMQITGNNCVWGASSRSAT